MFENNVAEKYLFWFNTTTLIYNIYVLLKVSLTSVDIFLSFYLFYTTVKLQFLLQKYHHTSHLQTLSADIFCGQL